MTRIRHTLAYWSAVAVMVIALGFTRTAEAQTTRPPCPFLSAQSTVQSVTTGPYAGLYKYTITITWDVGVHDPSHLDILIGLDNCMCVCDPRLFRFPTPAGTSTGINGGGACTVPYAGGYVCKGDPSIKNTTTGPAIKFEPDETLCSTDEAGTGTFVFYSPLPPSPIDIQPNAIAIKHGYDTCYGPIIGTLPMCDCSVPSNNATWGKVKSFYR